MNRSYRILPVYTADVSGVCSALYELGGMVVMHDPSGCNSTYNTHDETRWYDRDSLIFISGLTERDAILGNDRKFMDAVAESAARFHPRFVALAGSPIPYMNGTDFPALARLLEQRAGLPCFAIPTNGMHDYVCGAGAALAEIARRFVPPGGVPEAHTLNLLGVTPLDFGGTETHTQSSLRAALEARGWRVRSCWAMGDSLDALSHAGGAAVNLVVSAVGFAAAEVLRTRCGTPWVAGLPLGGFAPQLAAALEQAQETGACAVPYAETISADADADFTLIGEPVRMGSLCATLSRRGQTARVLCPLEADPALLGASCRVTGEEEAEAALRGARRVAADPLYRAVCPQETAFDPLPHQAFSGRCFWKTAPDLIRFFEEEHWPWD